MRELEGWRSRRDEWALEHSRRVKYACVYVCACVFNQVPLSLRHLLLLLRLAWQTDDRVGDVESVAGGVRCFGRRSEEVRRRRRRLQTAQDRREGWREGGGITYLVACTDPGAVWRRRWPCRPLGLREAITVVWLCGNLHRGPPSAAGGAAIQAADNNAAEEWRWRRAYLV